MHECAEMRFDGKSRPMLISYFSSFINYSDFVNNFIKYCSLQEKINICSDFIPGLN